MKPDTIILEGVCGSKAYGLDTATSDTDIKGVYLLPTKTVLGLNFNQQKTTKDHTDPDWAYYETGKFMKLVSGGNPTLTELLFLADYTVITPVGQLLVDNRDIFLSTNAIINSYSGYTYSQAKRLCTRTGQGLDGYDSSLKNRFAKHTRHLVRLMLQGKELLETGTLTVKVSPEQREYIFSCGELSANEVVDLFMKLDEEFKNTKSVLPDKPDLEKMNDLLLRIRYENL